MVLYFNKEGKLTTILPHGEIPRQGGDLNIWAIVDSDDIYLHYEQLWLRYKRPGKSIFDPDIPMNKTKYTYTFNILYDKEIENIGDLENGKTYTNVYHTNLSDTLAVKSFGNLELVFSLFKLNVPLKKDGTTDYSRAELGPNKMLGKTVIYIEEMLGLSPYSSVGMTPSEYNNLRGEIMAMQEDLTSNRVGLLRVSDYDAETGEVSLMYDDEIVDNIEYDADSGIMKIVW